MARDYYQCTIFPYPMGRLRGAWHQSATGRDARSIPEPKVILPIADEFIRRWREECSERNLYVETRCFGYPVRVYIEPAFRDIGYPLREDRRNGDKSNWNKARRYRFLPCVRELLLNSEVPPIVNDRNNSLVLLGKANHRPRECFKVIIKEGEPEPGLYGYFLATFFPVDDWDK
ncbi:hypothetical protein Desti_1359 [Desulfomonile tiedjei DSM 6799]|uniref:Uncharacterized protein n=1 Tax=Desulfomonile tiedjei (strain ATCC 49306 / DSM 6799 / DCB-1) TaxID=706587 RepID=I4C3D1_DESTA|nr:hypothetical protein Desti_1359 [Desulfomonile tiedjei DSM 6799]